MPGRGHHRAFFCRGATISPPFADGDVPIRVYLDSNGKYQEVPPPGYKPAIESTATSHLTHHPRVEPQPGLLSVVIRNAGKLLFVAAIVASGVRICRAIYEEVTVEARIDGLEMTVQYLKRNLGNTVDKEQRAKEWKLLHTSLRQLYEERDCKANPGKKTLTLAVQIGVDWAGAAVVGYLCTTVGEYCFGPKIGGFVGLMFGVVGGGSSLRQVLFGSEE